MSKYQFLTANAADPHIVKLFTNHLIAAFEQFIADYPGNVDYVDGFMAVHNFHKAITGLPGRSSFRPCLPGGKSADTAASISNIERRNMNYFREKTINYFTPQELALLYHVLNTSTGNGVEITDIMEIIKGRIGAAEIERVAQERGYYRYAQDWESELSSLDK
jgi:hypothetical protein